MAAAAVAIRRSRTSVTINDPFSHAGQAQALPIKRFWIKNRSAQEHVPLSNNIHFDNHVVRGNTHKAQIITSRQQRDIERTRKDEDTKRRKFQLAAKQASLKIPMTPPPMPGRQHNENQTDEYLEELMDRPLDKEAECQTNSFLDRPSSPLFMPAKTGCDQDTQIEDGELFDFDVEVIPVLEVLVGKTLETAFYEVMEEEEIEILRQRQAEFEKIRNAELAEVQRLEAEVRRKEEEKARRIDQEKERVKQWKELERRVAAQAYVKSYLNDLQGSIFDQMEAEGAFYDPVKREIETLFVPWLVEKVGVHRHELQLVSDIVDEAIMNVSEQLCKTQEERAFKEAEEATKQEGEPTPILGSSMKRRSSEGLVEEGATKTTVEREP